MRLRKYSKSLINATAGVFGARVVGANWGPRGVRETLERARSRGFSPKLVFDIGASNGQWTRECRGVFGDARYVLVDPLEHNRDALSEYARGDDRIRVFHGVAGSHIGEIPFYDHGDQSSVLSSSDFPGALRSVQATTVDSLLDSQQPMSPVLLKADVQGYELEVLRGAPRCLEAAEMLILEVSFRKIYNDSPLAHDIIAYVGERGFRIYDICSYIQRSTDSDLLQSDLVFVHESSSLLRHQGWT